MTKDERKERSRLRAEEYQRKRRLRLTLAIVGIALYVFVPLLWYGAIEFGIVQPIRTPEFRSAVNLAGGFLLIGSILLFSELRRTQKPEKESDRIVKEIDPQQAA